MFEMYVCRWHFGRTDLNANVMEWTPLSRSINHAVFVEMQAPVWSPWLLAAGTTHPPRCYGESEWSRDTLIVTQHNLVPSLSQLAIGAEMSPIITPDPTAIQWPTLSPSLFLNRFLQLLLAVAWKICSVSLRSMRGGVASLWTEEALVDLSVNAVGEVRKTKPRSLICVSVSL